MKRIFCISMAFWMLILAACGGAPAPNVPEDTSPGEDSSPQEGKLIFAEDAFDRMNIPSDAVCYDHLEAALPPLDLELVQNCFFQGQEAVQEETHGSDSSGGYLAENEAGDILWVSYQEGKLQELSYISFWFQETIGSGSPLIKDYPASVGSFVLNNLDQLPTDTGDLDFATAEEAENTVRQILDLLLGAALSYTEIYALPPDVLAKLSSDGPDNLHILGEEDAVYYMIFRGGYDGLTFSREGSLGPGMNITVYFSARGIENLSVTSAYQVTEAGQPVKMPTEEDARAAILAKYDTIILSRDTTIEEVTLEYSMDPSGSGLLPSWRVIVDEKVPDDAYIEKYCVRFNALTGKDFFR